VTLDLLKHGEVDSDRPMLDGFAVRDAEHMDLGPSRPQRRPPGVGACEEIRSLCGVPYWVYQTSTRSPSVIVAWCSTLRPEKLESSQLGDDIEDVQARLAVDVIVEVRGRTGP
jgi:hypothetical protein